MLLHATSSLISVGYNYRSIIHFSVRIRTSSCICVSSLCSVLMIDSSTVLLANGFKVDFRHSSNDGFG